MFIHSIKNVCFRNSAKHIPLTAKGIGKIELRLNDRNAEPVVCIDVSSADWCLLSAELTEKLTGIHDLYFVFSEKNLCLKEWQTEI